MGRAPGGGEGRVIKWCLEMVVLFGGGDGGRWGIWGGEHGRWMDMGLWGGKYGAVGGGMGIWRHGGGGIESWGGMWGHGKGGHM